MKDIKKGIFSPSWLVIWGTIPAALIGVKFGDQLEEFLGKPLIVATMMVLVGGLFIIMENISKKDRNLENLTFADSIVIGLSQVVALIPGTSRSGITIIAGLGRGLKREAAVEFSFLLSLVIIAGASLLKVPKLLSQNMTSPEWLYLGLAFLTAAASGFWAISFLMKFIKTKSLKPFAYYRFCLAAVIVIYYLVA
ncbi:MAG: undecaprenyl-diphosphate phosphatase [bacterium]